MFLLIDKTRDRKRKYNRKLIYLIRYGICVNFYRQMERRVSQSSRSKTDDGNDEEGNDRNSGSSTVCRRCLSLVSLCIISHHPFFSTFRECLNILKKMIHLFSERNKDKRHKRY